MYGEGDIEELDRIAGRAGTEGGSAKDVVDATAVVVDGSDDAEGCMPARSHGFGGDAIVVVVRYRGKQWRVLWLVAFEPTRLAVQEAQTHLPPHGQVGRIFLRGSRGRNLPRWTIIADSPSHQWHTSRFLHLACPLYLICQPSL